MTHDQGVDMADHVHATLTTNIPVFFCNPIHPGNAAATTTPTAYSTNTSPKAPASIHSQADLDAVAAKLNGYPEKPSTGAPPPKPSTNI
jgi:transposase, IS30 family